MKGMGRLIGVGVGPGDPGLVTLKAVEAIRQATMLAFPINKESAPSRAFETVRMHVRPETELLPLLMPMTRDQERLAEAHEAAAAAIESAAAGGRDVTYLSLGDPLFYSTFGYLAERFPGEVEVISGIAAMSACAAALGVPLAAGDTPTVVVTGASHASLKQALDMQASIVIMKPRGLSARSLDLLEESGAFDRASAAIELGGSGQRIISRLDRRSAEQLPYFAVIWIKQP